ncbi:MAG: anti-sigma factor [Streptosporangiaceae bacterium]
MRFLRHDLHSLSGAYALDALEGGAERDRFTRHLSRCQSCASEVRGFREVATALAFAVTAEPPPELRDRVLAAAARTRQLPPEVKTNGVHARPQRTRAWVPWVPWLSGVVATASIVVAVLFGFAQAHTQQELNQARAVSQAISLLLSSPQATLLSHSTTKGGVATVVLVADKHELAVITNGLPALPAGKVYQLWLIGKTKTVSAGLLPPAQAGRTPAVLASGVVKGDTLGLTVEPAPGSAQPTTTPILALPLPV